MDHRLQEIQGRVDVDFFKQWSAQMAYVLGYFAADGCLSTNPLGARYIHFDSTDLEQLETVKTLLSSKQVISVKPAAQRTWKTCYRIQIGSRQVFADLTELGFGVRKGGRMTLPNIPTDFLSDFVRGYFDGDGGISYGEYAKANRSGKVRVLLTRFTSASKGFLESLRKALQIEANMGRGSLICYGTYACLSYAYGNSVRLFQFMYRDGDRKRSISEAKIRKVPARITILF
jgi:hypothetical protein